MSKDRRYARGAEDAQEFIARLLERTASGSSPVTLQTLTHIIRTLAPEAIHAAMEADDAWMRKVAERELERQRAGWRARTAGYQERQRLRVAGEDVPAPPRGRTKGGR